VNDIQALNCPDVRKIILLDFKLDCILTIKWCFYCRFFEIFEKYDGYKDGHVKLKRPKQLQEILDIARSLLNEIQHRAADPEIEEKQGKLEQLKSVLEM
jgi:hypothetical protein